MTAASTVITEPGRPAPQQKQARLGDPLTEREMQVLLLLPGHTSVEIGAALYLAPDTVKTHCRRLFRKLGARDRAHAVLIGCARGLYNGIHITGPEPEPAPAAARPLSDRHTVSCTALRPSPCNCRPTPGAASSDSTRSTE